MEFETPYLTKQIITYIGNKRKLLSLIYKAMKAVGAKMENGTTFLDLFAGSGVVSRFAKSLGFEVFANDWEEYSFIINSAFVGTNRSEIEELFGGEKELSKLLNEINSLPLPSEDEQYMAKYYAPKSFDVDAADFRTERLFYTKDNALTIDKIRNFIEAKYPSKSDKARILLLSLLLYEASCHTNTSGVFKSFHKGFGGHSRDALKRILCPIRLSLPCLIDSKASCHIFKEDANSLVKSGKLPRVEIAYLDPPYNQHQYGSNYHILNTIAKWDCLPAPLELNEKGVLKEKAAIRKDWVLTKSAYCYKASASQTFAELLDNIDAHYILVSYSTDGIIPFDEMERLCMKKGKLSIVTNEYTTFRGGKQSNTKEVSNIEFILAIDTTKKSSERAASTIANVLFRKQFYLLFKKSFSLKRLKANGCTVEKGKVLVSYKGEKKSFALKNASELILDEECMSLSIAKMKKLYAVLEKCTFETKEEELDMLLELLTGNYELSAAEKVNIIKRLPNSLKKLAQKKTRFVFADRVLKIKALEAKLPELYAIIAEKIVAIEELASIRFNS